ncbi:BA14K family protein [Aquibium microcysteis]|uniref:BA14K family protein n=1 Tax=Aquibium microcysteis TaxID=675281 RepID=UPI001EF2EB06|nr:BA14K family protein [Aquibium microcysteis]
MKIVLVILSGVVATLGLYGSGFVTAMAFLSADPTPVWKPNRDERGLWTLEPVKVAEDQNLERLPARSGSGTLVASAAAADEADEEGAGGMSAEAVSLGKTWSAGEAGDPRSVDETRTASIGSDDDPADGFDDDAPQLRAPAMSMAHVRWCLDRYRSYRVEDNSYTPYSGGSRACVSPYSGATAEVPVARRSYAQAQPSVQRRGYLSSRHIQSCFDRYRSYRPSDNSYQPYGGGPRRQCR